MCPSTIPSCSGMSAVVDIKAARRAPCWSSAGRQPACSAPDFHALPIRPATSRRPQACPAWLITNCLTVATDPSTLANRNSSAPAWKRSSIAPRLKAALGGLRWAGIWLAYAVRPAVRGAAPRRLTTQFIAFLRTTPAPSGPRPKSSSCNRRPTCWRRLPLRRLGNWRVLARHSRPGFASSLMSSVTAAHHRKHSVLYQAVMRDFGLSDAYDAYAPSVRHRQPGIAQHHPFPVPDTSLHLSAVGFLLFAGDRPYQRSTADHFRYLRTAPSCRSRPPFGEHAHIDLHHTRTDEIDDVAAPLVARDGPEAGVADRGGRAAHPRQSPPGAGAHLLAVSRAFADAAAAGEAWYGAPGELENRPGLSPRDAARLDGSSCRDRENRRRRRDLSCDGFQRRYG